MSTPKCERPEEARGELRKWESLERRPPPGLRRSRGDPGPRNRAPGASGDVEERATRERGPGHRRAGGCTGRGGSAERSWVERRQVGRGDGAPRRPGRESQGPPGTWAGSGLSGNGGREGRCDGSKKEYTSGRHRTRRARRGAGKGEAAHGGKKTQGKNAGELPKLQCFDILLAELI
ncbi:unnamed protein product [Nyctereutes procyonoides]|uniref:(raccoon dog) hypothetical protein n=1 Tax=Nyctereutes procyonoides TaxID=34880 RepID=A0A811Y7Y2_NYCPR|nr:unnamed protein product [Nyctereutes procyonoides]